MLKGLGVWFLTISGTLERCMWERVAGYVEGFGGLVLDHIWDLGTLHVGVCCRTCKRVWGSGF